MFYSNLLKGVAIAAMAVGLTSCGGNTSKKSASQEDANQVKVSTITETESPQEVLNSIVEVAEECVAEVTEVAEVAETDTSEWDDLLDEYEEYIDDYIACLEDVNSGDLSAMGDMAELLEQTEKFTEKINNISSNLTVAQSARYAKLTQKLANAASNF